MKLIVEEKEESFSYLMVLRWRKNPNNFKACKRVDSLLLFNNLKTVLKQKKKKSARDEMRLKFYRNPCRRSNAGTIVFGCSDIRLTAMSNTSIKFSS